MRPWMLALGVSGLVIVFVVSGRNDGQPRAGETVTPHLEWPVHWTAGGTGDLGIRLYAKGPDALSPRLLDFSAVPLQLTPVANIAFYSGDQPLSSLEVALSHRC